MPEGSYITLNINGVLTSLASLTKMIKHVGVHCPAGTPRKAADELFGAVEALARSGLTEAAYLRAARALAKDAGASVDYHAKRGGYRINLGTGGDPELVDLARAIAEGDGEPEAIMQQLQDLLDDAGGSAAFGAVSGNVGAYVGTSGDPARIARILVILNSSNTVKERLVAVRNELVSGYTQKRRNNEGARGGVYASAVHAAGVVDDPDWCVGQGVEMRDAGITYSAGGERCVMLTGVTVLLSAKHDDVAVLLADGTVHKTGSGVAGYQTATFLQAFMGFRQVAEQQRVLQQEKEAMLQQCRAFQATRAAATVVLSASELAAEAGKLAALRRGQAARQAMVAALRERTRGMVNIVQPPYAHPPAQQPVSLLQRVCDAALAPPTGGQGMQWDATQPSVALSGVPPGGTGAQPGAAVAVPAAPGGMLPPYTAAALRAPGAAGMGTAAAGGGHTVDPPPLVLTAPTAKGTKRRASAAGGGKAKKRKPAPPLPGQRSITSAFGKPDAP
jgi:hypothetical protein